MKAKRILSAFLAVAVVLTTLVTLSTVSFAEDAPTITVTVESATVSGAEDGQYGYNIHLKLSNYGTLSANDDDYSGRKLAMWQANLVFEEGVAVKTVLGKSPKTDITTVKPAAPLVDEYVVNATMQSGAADTYFPYDAGEYKGEELLLLTIPIITTQEEFTFQFNASLVIANTNADTGACEGDLAEIGISSPSDVTYKNKTLIAPTKVYYPEVNLPAITPSTDGVAGTGASEGKTFANLISVISEITNATEATEAGVLFMPKTLLDGAELTTATTNVAKALVNVTNDIVEGTLNLKAALINIPADANGAVMVSRTFVTRGGATTYGTAAETTIVSSQAQ